MLDSRHRRRDAVPSGGHHDADSSMYPECARRIDVCGRNQVSPSIELVAPRSQHASDRGRPLACCTPPQAPERSCRLRWHRVDRGACGGGTEDRVPADGERLIEIQDEPSGKGR